MRFSAPLVIVLVLLSACGGNRAPDTLQASLSEVAKPPECPDRTPPPCEPPVCECYDADGNCVACGPPHRLNPPIDVDGSLLKDPGGEIDVCYGGARFAINSVTEFFVLGFDPAKVILLPPGVLSKLNTIPRNGTLLKERNKDAIFLIEVGKKIPLRDDKDVNDHGGFGAVHIVPEHSLDKIPGC